MGGGLGIGFVRDSEGDVRIVGVAAGGAPGGPRDVQTWDKVTEVNGVPIDTHLTTVSLAWAGYEASYPAVDGNIDAERLAYLARGPIGADVTLTIERDGDAPFESVISATEGLLADTKKFGKGYQHAASSSCVTSRVLAADGGNGVMGYLQIASFLQASEEACVDMAGAVRTAIASFKSAGAVGVVVDLRGNGGGEDADVPNVLKYFASASFYYEVVALPRQTLIDLNGASATDGKTAVATADGDYFVSDRYLVTPAAAADRWTGGPVAVLVNRVVMSNGDMAANALKSLGASVVGFEGTSGSASMSGGTIALPCITVTHTQAQSWDPDAEGTIQVEARTTDGGARVGGVSPTHAVPRTRANLENDLKWRSGEAGATDPTLEYARGVLTQRIADGLPSPPPPAASPPPPPPESASPPPADDDEATDGDDEEPAVVDGPPPAGGALALAGGVLAAVIVAPVVVVVIIVALVVYCCCCRRKQGATPTYAGKEAQPPAY